ncbi:MAG: hypothetical protein G01um101413_296 [Parcubacteria group bacterium Gr01-1014_13]|nr:MAG: hypothetical protein G01um101413_296 [Parcubacteria group bacterium Gr01-1014_13]
MKIQVLSNIDKTSFLCYTPPVSPLTMGMVEGDYTTSHERGWNMMKFEDTAPDSGEYTYPGRPNGHNNGQNTREEKLRNYKGIILCQTCSGQHGWVEFGGALPRSIHILIDDDIKVLGQLMDLESAMKFREDVVKLRGSGEINLPFREEQNCTTTNKVVKQFVKELEDLIDQSARLRAASFSRYALAKAAVDHMVRGLNNPELNPIFAGMSDQEMVIRIKVVDTATSHEIFDQILDPQDLISHDDSKEEARLEEKYHNLFRRSIMNTRRDY